MKRVLSISLVILFAKMTTVDGAVRIELKGDIPNAPAISVFDGILIIPDGERRDVFAGPYTLAFQPSGKQPDGCTLKVSLTGLGPEFRNFTYNLDLNTGERTLIPSLPVKNDAVINYSIELLDDTSKVGGYGSDSSEPVKWGESASVHYLTRWVKGSLADFTWNTKMSYLENIYDQYRYSYKLSMFEKIETTFYPEPTDLVYIDPVRHYSILPGSRKIDLVYGHNIDAATPAPGAELVIYRLWGYGPRWMVTGLAHFYEDNSLILREFAGTLDPSAVAKNIAFDNWVDSDTGTVFCGAFVNWLITEHGISKFENLYKKSSPSDFARNFDDIYGNDFLAFISDFLAFSENYKPKDGELSYYASIYLRHNNFVRAGDLYAELAAEDSGSKEEYLVNLAACRFWSGDYESSRDVYKRITNLYKDKPRYSMLMGDVQLALGNFKAAMRSYEDAFFDDGYGDAGLRLVSILIDEGRPDSARSIFSRLNGDVLKRMDYSVERARLDMIYHKPGYDSILTATVNRALSAATGAPDNPDAYLIAGKACALSGNFDKAENDLRIAFFLERRTPYLARILLELGKTADMQQERDSAIAYYHQAENAGGGQYIVKLCRKYIESPYKEGT